MKPTILRGAHSLSVMFAVKDEETLRRAMRTTVECEGTLFEIPFILCEIPWETVAKIAKEEGIQEIVLCHFWPYGAESKSLCGDPLSKYPDERHLAMITWQKIIEAALVIRENGMTIRFIDGPSWGGLARDYDKEAAMIIEGRMITFLRIAGDMCQNANLIIAVEFLRPVEDKVVRGTRNMIRLLTIINHPAVKMHFDVFHALECDEDPGEMIRLAWKWIVYLHLHGTKRLAPGQDGDECDWADIASAIQDIRSGVSNIPGISEPFGKETCAENPALGEGLPEALPLREYLIKSFATLSAAGI